MGCDIHSFAEVKKKSFWDHLLFRPGKWIRAENFLTLDNYDQQLLKKKKGSEPFNWRSYAVFGFLAGVRNYSHCEPIAERRGLPDDSEYLNETTEDAWGWKESRRSDILESGYCHSYSYLTLKELLDFDYEQKFWDRRVMKQEGPNSFNGAALAEEGEGETITYKEHLASGFFQHIEDLKTLGSPENVRVVFWFDN